MSSKHPKAEPIQPEALITGKLPDSLHPIFYAEIDGELVKKCALRTKGGAGVSQQEDVLWHKMVTGHKMPLPLYAVALVLVASQPNTSTLLDLKPCSQIEA